MNQLSNSIKAVLALSSFLLFSVDFFLLNLQTYLLYFLYFVGLGKPKKTLRRSCPVVVVSGSNSGIGLETAKKLCSLGYIVFAGYRSHSAKTFLESLNNKNFKGKIIPVELDVCKKETISSTARTVQDFLVDKNYYLEGIVSNAGYADVCPLELYSYEEMQTMFKTNYFGALQFVQTFLYLLKRDEGRVVFIGSIASKSLNKNLGIYSATKAALRSTSVIINAELNEFNVNCVLIEPGSFRTRATDVIEEKLEKGSSKNKNTEIYIKSLKNFQNKYKLAANFAHPPTHVVQHVVHALKAPIVKSTYLVGWDAYLMGALEYIPEIIAERIRCFV